MQSGADLGEMYLAVASGGEYYGLVVDTEGEGEVDLAPVIQGHRRPGAPVGPPVQHAVGGGYVQVAADGQQVHVRPVRDRRDGVDPAR
jgi:hypothetical protein